MQQDPSKRWVFSLLKLAVSAVTLWIVARSVAVDQTFDLVSQSSVLMLAFAAGIFGVGQVLSSLRCLFIIRTLGGDLSFKSSLRIYFIGFWFNQVLPTSLGGDVVKVGMLRPKIGLSLGARGTVLDRVSGLMFVLFSLVALLPAYVFFFPDAMIALTLGAGASAVIILVALIARFARSVSNRSEHSLVLRLAQLFSDIYEFRSGRPLRDQLILSMLVHFAGIFTYVAIGVAVGAQISFLAYLLLTPLVFLVGLLPISLAGWGVREVGTIWLFGYAGVPPETALAISVLFGLTLIAASSPGLILLLAPNLRSRHDSPASN